jgi:hypothetical protein
MQDGSGAPLLQGVPARVESIIDDALLGADGVEADGADPRPDDDARSVHWDLVVCGVGPSTPEFLAPGDAV